MAAQAFFYNAIFFTYALVLTDFYGAGASASAGTSCPSPPAISLGRSLLGRLFDTIGRRIMIAIDLCAVGHCSLVAVGVLFERDLLTADTQTIGWMIVFFFRLGGGELRLSHGQRDLPARDPRARDRVLLRHRHRRSAASRRPRVRQLIETGSRAKHFRRLCFRARS